MDGRKSNNVGEFEPRTLPRQLLAATTETVPTVPEVSLAFDIPRQVNFHADEPMPSPRNGQNTYAVWKQKVPQKHTYNNNYGHANIPQKAQTVNPQMTNRRETITCVSPVKNSSGRAANPYTMDSRLKFYQKVPSDPPGPRIQAELMTNQVNNVRSTPISLERVAPADRNPQAMVASDLVMKTQFKVSKNEQLERNCDHYTNHSANEDIIKQLLCLVQSQNAQIQLLQAQVETLLSVRNENPKKLSEYPKTPLPIHNVSTNTADALSQNLRIHKSQREPSELDENPRDEKTQKITNEKKVSIGVMTSFELTVQDSVIYNTENSPGNADYQVKNCDSIVNRNQPIEILAPVKNTPRGPLEQIVEDSESHLSSAMQASNNYRTYSSVKKSLQANVEADKSRSEESPPIDCHSQSQGIPNRMTEMATSTSRYSASNSPLPFENNQKKVINQHKHSPVQEIQSTRPQVVPVNGRDDVPVDTVNQKKTPKVGWTLYDNVMCQVNEILHNTEEVGAAESRRSIEAIQEVDQSKLLLNELQQSTIEQLKLFGLTFAENSGYSGGGSPLNISKRIPLDTSYYPRLDYQANFHQTSNSASDSSTSMHMKALALKYLGIKQFPNVSTHQKGVELITNMVVNKIQNNISFTSINEGPKIDSDPQYQRMQRAVTDSRNRDNYLANAKRNPKNILDISTLKRQPKLL